MSDFKAKMHQIRFRTPLGELTALPQILAGFKGPTSKGKGEEGKGGNGRKGNGEGKGGRERGKGKREE